MRKFISFTLMLLIIAACSASSDNTNMSADNASITLIVGESFQLTASLSLSKTAKTAVVWESAAPSIATVSSTGLVSAIATGNTTITAKSVDGNNSETYAVTIIPMLNRQNMTLLAGTKFQLKASISSSTIINKPLAWTTSNITVAAVTGTGLVTAVSPGSAVITATTADGNVTASCSVTCRGAESIVVILKADDLTASVSGAFAKYFDICSHEEIPCSAGLIIASLNSSTIIQQQFLQNLDPQDCELWLHGYTHYMKSGQTEFIGPTLDEQIQVLQYAMDDSNKYLKRELSTFGAPGNAWDINTSIALDKFPSIKTVFFAPPGGSRTVLPRLVAAEITIGLMHDHGYIIDNTKMLPPGSVAVLQLHPNGWGDKDWSEFNLTIAGLKSMGVVFMTPSDYTRWKTVAK